LTCGLYQVEDFGDRMLYSITTFTGAPSKLPQTLYTITNPATAVVKGMVRGLCYCALGEIRQDPEFEGDRNFLLLTIETLEGPPFSNCLP